MLRIHEIKLKPGERTENIPGKIKKKLGLPELVISQWKIAKESLDARDKSDIRWVYSVDFCAKRPQTEAFILAAGKKRKVKIAETPDTSYRFVLDENGLPRDGERREREPLQNPPVVVGFGPCGMFAALILAQMGYRPLVLERGKPIDERVRDVERFWREGILDPESNVQFGEGGAGAFSDGKLTTQIKDRRIYKVLSELARAGGGDELLYKQKPHVGTDVLRQVVRNIRQEILRLGGEIRFSCRLTGLRFEEQTRALSGLAVQCAGETEERVIPAQTAVLALGHSARDTMRALFAQGIPMEQKPFSMGVRIEHSQSMINEAQYGARYRELGLPPAEYKLAYRCQNGRGVYTFCMCPGGRVIASASQEGGLVTNGMSYRSRDMENANSALLADVRTEDFPDAHPLAGIAFQEYWERQAFLAGGGAYLAPAQRVGDFLARASEQRAEGTSKQQAECSPCGVGRKAETVPSYAPGITWAQLSNCLPDFVSEALREALPELGKKLAGFDRPDAVMTALESRSSSPVRIPRKENLTCGVKGLYAAGEGAGYAGGITSAAVDGIRMAEEIALTYFIC